MKIGKRNYDNKALAMGAALAAVALSLPWTASTTESVIVKMRGFFNSLFQRG